MSSKLRGTVAMLFDEDDDEEDAAVLDGPSSSRGIDATGLPLQQYVRPVAWQSGVSALPHALAVMSALSVVVSRPPVLETAAKFLCHLSRVFYDTAVRRAAANLAALAQAQERELRDAFEAAADSLGGTTVVSDAVTTAIVRRHAGQRREAAEKQRSRRRDALRNTLREFTAFVETAAQDLARAGNDASLEAKGLGREESFLDDVAGTVAPLIDFDVEEDVPAVQLLLDNELARQLQDGSADPTAPSLLVDVSPTSAVSCCIQVPVGLAINPRLSDSFTGEFKRAEQASERRAGLHLRRLFGQRRHSVLCYIGSWIEFKTMYDDARSTFVDPIWSMSDTLPDTQPSVSGPVGTVLAAANLWGASIVVFISATPDRQSTPQVAALRAVFVAAATSWRADMVSIVWGASLLRPQRHLPSSSSPPPRSSSSSGTAESPTESCLMASIKAATSALAYAARECHTLRTSAHHTATMPVATADPRLASPRGLSALTRPGYALGYSVRYFVPASTLDECCEIVLRCAKGVEVVRRYRR